MRALGGNPPHQGLNTVVAKGNAPGPAIQVVHLTPAATVDGMSESISCHDWAQTRLGALPHWPPALRIAVDMMLQSPFPSALVWGTELTVIHNDAYRALLPRPDGGLGAAFDTLWREHWANIGPWVFKALGGHSSFVEDTPVRIALPGTGGHAWFAFSYTPIRDDHGAVAGFLHTVIDTTASIETIDAWRERALTFEKQIARYRVDRDHIWQLSQDAMIVVSRDLRLQAANPAWYQMLGWRETQSPGMPLIDLVHPADRHEASTAALEVLHGKGVDQIDTRVRHSEGHYRWFRWSARLEGELLTAVGRDISSEREEAMRQTQALLRNSQRLGAVGQLAGGMAHEMNNLLSGIGGSLELLQRRFAQGRLERIDNYVQLARDSVQRAMLLTHRLLAFSKNQPLSAKPLEVNQHLLALEPMLLQALGPEMRLQWQLDMAPWRVRVDAGQLQNALINLCANARDACLPSGTLTLRTANQRLTSSDPEDSGLPAGDYVAIHLEDDGHGMTAEDVARAFEPFFTTKPAGRGAGLGLSMVYGFVSQSDGHVWIESTLEQGTRVVLLFPRCLEALEEPAPVEPLAALQAARGERLLLIDDETNLRKLMKEALVDHGFEVHDVADANAAMAQFRHNGAFDLVITDIGLPGGFSGRQLAKAMRLLKPEQKILFITGYTEDPVEQQLLDEPGTALMLKPFSLSLLVGQVQRLFNP
ncbi:ATP-binding protein [Pseudomonas reidholzensis]|uniref:ATP-binding protein n=1 Tax=Pseudomonas reidholzensis TaxID=1785162 RepID=UPI001FC9A7C5|nr:ATP-binding protein [Pseudomonas reidholzensis]